MTLDTTAGEPTIGLNTDTFRYSVQTLDVEFRNFVWSPSGRVLYFQGMAHGVQNLWRVTVDPATHAVLGGPDRLTVGAGADGHPAVGRDDGRILFEIRSAQTRLWSFPFDATAGHTSGSGRPLTAGVPGELDPDASSDGKKFAYSVNRGEQHEVW